MKMYRLLQIEVNKILYYRIFWILMGLYSVLLFLTFYGAGDYEFRLQNHTFNLSALAIYDFPNIWHNLTYMAGFFHWILGIVTIILITNEINFRTIRQNIIDGLSRMQVLAGKLQLIFGIAVIVTLIISLIGLGTGLIYSSSIGIDIILKKIGYLGAFLLQIIAKMTMALIFALIFKRAGPSVILYLLYIIAIEPMIAYSLVDQVSKYLPNNIFNKVIVNPYSGMWGGVVPESPFTEYFWLGIGYCIVLWGIAYLLIWRRDW